MGFRDVLGKPVPQTLSCMALPTTLHLYRVCSTSYTVNVCANRPGLDNTVTIQINLEGRLGSNTQFVYLGNGSIQVSLVGQDPDATSLPPTGDCNDSYYRMSWRMGGATDFVHYTVVYTIGNLNSRTVTVPGRSTTSYMVTGVAGANVGDSINWRVRSAHVFIDDDDNHQGSSFPVGSGTGTMQACPSGPATDTFTPTHTVSPTTCNPPRNMTFNRYNTSSRVIYFDFTAPVSGGLNRLHFQPQYRRLPSTTWIDTSFTVAANNTSWALIFNNESFTFGRTIEFRLLSICTGNVRSDPSNVVFYTYPAEPGTATSTFTPVPSVCQPPRNMTFNRYADSTRFIYFDFTAPVSGGLNRLHYQPQYRRLPSTTWTSTSFTVASNRTEWNVRFTNESFTAGRTFEFRLLAVCTGNVESVPSNVVSYTYPGPTQTNTPSAPLECQPARNMTFNRYEDSDVSIYFDFDAPVSGSLSRLHFQPQYRRLPSGAWIDPDFTVAANRTDWGIRFFTDFFTSGRTLEFRLISVCTGNVESEPSNVVAYTFPGPILTPTYTGTPTRTDTPTITPTITLAPPPSFCPAPSGLRFLTLTDDDTSVTWNPVNYNIQCQVSNLRYTSTDPNDVQVEWDNPPHITEGRYSYGYGGSSFFEPFVTDADAQPGERRIEDFQLEVQTRCSDGTEGTAVTSLLQFDYGPRSEEQGTVLDLPDQSSWPYGPPQDLEVAGTEEKYLRLSWTAPEKGIPDGYRWEVRRNGSVVNTSETSALSATVPNTSRPGDELTITVYSLYDHPEFGRIEYLVRAIIEREGDGQIGPRSPTGYYLSWSLNGEEFFEPSFPYTIYIYDVTLGGYFNPGDRVQLRLQTLCTERPEPIVSNFVFSSIMTVPDNTPTPTETPFGTPPPTPTDHPGYSSCPRPGNPRFDYANTDGVFFSFNPASYTNPCEVSGLRYTSTSIDDVRLEWTNPSNLVHLRINGLASGSLQDDEPFTTDWDQDLTRFNTDNITFELILFSRCSDGTQGVRTSQPLVFGTGFEPFAQPKSSLCAAADPGSNPTCRWTATERGPTVCRSIPPSPT